MGTDAVSLLPTDQVVDFTRDDAIICDERTGECVAVPLEEPSEPAKTTGLPADAFEGLAVSGNYQCESPFTVPRVFAPCRITNPEYFESDLARRGAALAGAHRWNDAIQVFREAATQYPESADAHFNLALALYNEGDPEMEPAATDEMREAVHLNPNDSEARTALNRLLRELATD